MARWCLWHCAPYSGRRRSSTHIPGAILQFVEEALAIIRQAQTRENFQKVWYGRIRLEDFCSIKINWQAKSENIAAILREVNVLPEHVLFVDDNPLEIAEVSRAFPQMRTLTGDPHAWRMELLKGIPFQVAELSAEATQKTALLQAKIQRDGEMASTDRASYLRDLQMRVEIFPLGPDHPRFARAVELLNKTNQFNTTGQRWSLPELQDFLASGGQLLALRAADRMTDHGLVGLALLQNASLRQMVLSCRVFGLGLEDALLHQVAVQGGVPLHGADWVDTGKNATAREFLQRFFVLDQNPAALRQPPLWPEHLLVS